MNITRRDFLKTTAGVAAIAALPGFALAASEAQIPEPKRSMALYFEKTQGLGLGEWYRVPMPTGDEAMASMKRDKHELDDVFRVLGNADLIVHWDEDGQGEVFDGFGTDEILLKPDQISEEIMAVLKKLPVTDLGTVISKQAVEPLKPTKLFS
ncbi:MAG: twin-arginine translocation signal domain-containing protein [Nitrosomonadaceae bacterium]